MTGEILCANKPAGWLTHTDGNEVGFADQFYPKYKVVHRLDRDTSGCLLLANSTEMAAGLTQLFTNHDIQKTYLFVTDRPSHQDSFRNHSSYLLKKGNRVESSPRGRDTHRAQTSFLKIETHGRYSLWQAQPLTGKTHQIRVHASELGLNILGDTVYGGSPFDRVLLHCHQMQTSNSLFSQPPPDLFQNLETLQNSLLARWMSQTDRRQRLSREVFAAPEQTIRLVHDKENTGYCIDRLGPVAWFYRFIESPSISEYEKEAMQKFTRHVGCERFVCRQMINRGAAPLRAQEERKTWNALEGPIQYILKEEQGWSPGLFLDQRANRDWIRDNSRNKEVLNLFAYTAGFSVCAAWAHAKKVTTVDTSGKTLDWAKENFLANGIDPSQHFFNKMDAREFLKFAHKKKLLFDLVICDPPSFARNKKSVFKIEKEMKPLLEALTRVLNAKGKVLFSCNYEKWSLQEFHQQIPPQFKRLTLPLGLGDYEIPRQEPNMKAALLELV